MRKIKYLLCFVLMAAMASIYTPMGKNHNLNQAINEFPKEVSMSTTEDSKDILAPEYNCDPEMLITVVPDIDPQFLLKHLP
jgi:hypothetical protein